MTTPVFNASDTVPTFSLPRPGSGTVMADLGGISSGGGNPLVRPDGKTLLASIALGEPMHSDLGVRRPDADGSLDTSFGAPAPGTTAGGTVRCTEGDAAVALDASGRLGANGFAASASCRGAESSHLNEIARKLPCRKYIALRVDVFSSFAGGSGMIFMCCRNTIVPLEFMRFHRVAGSRAFQYPTEHQSSS